MNFEDRFIMFALNISIPKNENLQKRMVGSSHYQKAKAAYYKGLK